MNADILHSFAECLRSAGLEVEAFRPTAPAPLRHNGQAPAQGRRIQGVSGRSGLPLVEELAHRR